MAPTIALPEAVKTALEKEFEGVTPERKEQILGTVRAANAPAKPDAIRAELHKIFTEHLTLAERAFYQAIIVMPPDDAAGAVAAAKPQPPAPSPEAAATAVSEGARAAETKAAGSRAR